LTWPDLGSIAFEGFRTLFWTAYWIIENLRNRHNLADALHRTQKRAAFQANPKRRPFFALKLNSV
jgi:hypothetical protein